jgi:branched-chain amino acid transport system permease protein
MMILGQAALLIFGTHSRGMPSVFPGMIRIGGMSISVEKLVLIMLTTAVILALYFFLRKSKTGQAMRAVSFNADVAALQGINPERIYQSALVIGCALAGFAGAVMAPVYAVSPSMGSIIITVLLVVMFGGMNSVMGAALGGIILGLTLSFGYYFLGGGLAQILLFLAISIIVFFRPGGLFGESINEF